MNQRQIIWLAFTLITIICFLWLIPIGTYESAPMFWSFMGGILVFIGLFLLMSDYKSFFEMIDNSEDRKKNITPGRRLAPVAVIPGIIMVFVFILHQSNRVDNVLENEGVVTKAYIQDGDATTRTRRFQTSTSFNLVFNYTDSAGFAHVLEQGVSGSDFHSTYKGAEVSVVYWKKDPDVAKVLISQEDLAKYKKIPMGTIQLEQLLQVYKMNNSDSILNYLNSINYEWKYDNGLYINEQLELAIRIQNVGLKILTYVTEGISINQSTGRAESFDQNFEAEGFSKEASSVDNHSIYTYKKGSITITKTIESQVDKSSNIPTFKVYNIYQLIINE